jgi:prolyl-tRNA synthetase
MKISRPEQKRVSEWFLDIAKKSQLFDYGPVKGTIIIRPYAYAIWEKIQKILDNKIKALGCKNTYFPLLIPENLLSKEKEHIKGFSPELAVVNYVGGEKLQESLVVRPTSETIMYLLFSKWISSWRDLPLKINQWANVVRWELRPFPFLRTTEFLWQEGHTVHATLEEASKQTKDALEIYRFLFEEVLAIPVIIGKKTEREKFAGALYSTSCEALLIDGKALQIATSHNLGQNFSKTFEIYFQNKKGKKELVWQTSWGLSTRSLGGIFLTHGDIKGLIIPPAVAPIPVIIIPIYKNNNEKKIVLKKCLMILESIKKRGIEAEVDFRELVTPGWKFNDWEVKGVPLRIEVGPKEIEKQSVIIVRRDTGEKIIIFMNDLVKSVPKILNQIQKNLFKRAKQFVDENTHTTKTFKEFSDIIENKRGFIKATWCGDSECEKTIKEKTKATTRSISLEKEKIFGTCFYCGKMGKYNPVWARAH